MGLSKVCPSRFHLNTHSLRSNLEVIFFSGVLHPSLIGESVKKSLLNYPTTENYDNSFNNEYRFRLYQLSYDLTLRTFAVSENLSPEIPFLKLSMLSLGSFMVSDRYQSYEENKFKKFTNPTASIDKQQQQQLLNVSAEFSISLKDL